MKVGNRVKAQLKTVELRGVIQEVRDKGLMMTSPKRTHYVKLDEPYMQFPGMWFDPDDLVIDEDSTQPTGECAMTGPQEDDTQRAVDKLNDATGQDYELLDTSEERRDTNGR